MPLADLDSDDITRLLNGYKNAPAQKYKRGAGFVQGFTVAAQNAVVGLLTGGNLNAVPFEGASGARLMIRGTVTRIINDVPIRFGELVQMHRPLAELISGADAIGTEQPTAPNAENFAAVSKVAPLVTGDKVNDGYSEEATA